MKNIFTSLLLSSVFIFSSTAQSPFSFTNSNSKFTSTNFHSGNSVSVLDMDGDGLDDIARLDQSNDLYYTLQRTNQTFNNIHAVVTGTGSAWAMVAGDVNNDGVRDVAVGYGSSAKLIMANSALNSFPISTLPNSNYFLQNMNFADINNDGWIDLFGCNDVGTSKMWGNSGTGTYPATTNFFSTNNPGSSDNSGNYGSIWTDVNNDGHVDFYIAHCRQSTGSTDGNRLDQLFINTGSNNYILDTTGARGLRNYQQTWTASFEDIDNDGDLDCVLTETDAPSKLLANDGNGYFTDITAGSGFVLDITPYQSKMEDLDNDGYVDIIISGDDARIFHNNHNNTFTRIDGLFNTNNMLSFAIGDLNHDGKIDLYSTYGSVYNSPTSTDDVLWLNRANNANHFVTFNLQGTISNRDALGARVEVYGAWGKQIREVRAGESYGTTNTFMCHFGLGTATTIDSAVIRWPKGLVTTLYNRVVDQFITVIEGQCSSPDNVIAFNGPSTLCAGQSVTMTAPAGYSYLWNTGATTQSITTNTLGDFAVRVTDGSCSSISRQATILSQPDETPTITALSETVFCEGSSVVLQGSPASNYLWSNGDTTQTTTVTQPGTYALTIQGTCAPFTSSSITVSPIASHISNAVSVALCDNAANAITLGAVATGDAYWYDAATGGNIVATGESYTTPALSDTSITYYVESRDSLLGLSGFVGPVDSSFGTGGVLNSSQYQIFSVFKASTLKTVKVYCSTVGNRTFELRNSNGTLLQTATVNVQPGGYVVNLNFPLPVGTDFRLVVKGSPNLNLFRNNSNASYPYTIANLISITGNSVNNLGNWYFCYNWRVEEVPVACASTRVPVTAAVNPIPAADVTTSQATTICQGDSVTLSVTTGANTSYEWSNNETAPSIIVNTTGNFTVTVTDGDCSATSAPVTVTVTNNPVAGITASSSTSFCEGGSVELTASAGTSYLWSNNATTPTITVSSSGTYTVTVEVSGSCSAISLPVTVTENPFPTVSLTGLNAQYTNADAAVNLTGTPSGGTFTGTGVSGTTFDPAVAGVGGPYTITYEYTDGNGCAASATSQVTVLLASAIENIAGISNVTIYPNPNSGTFELTFKATENKRVDIAITNVVGQKVFEEYGVAVNNTTTKQITLANAAKGIYQLVLVSGKKQNTFKVVIQ
jgi:hypothetical protein